MDITASTFCGNAEWTSMLCPESFWKEKLVRRAQPMRAEIYWVPGPWPGRLGIVPRPRGRDWLADEVRSWRDAGISLVTSLLTPDEVSELGLEDEGPLCQEEGLEFR